MANESLQLIQKSDSALRIPLRSIPAGVLVSAATLVIKLDLADPDASALLEYSISTTPSAMGQVTNDAASNAASVLFNIAEADIDALTVGGQYEYAVKFWLSDGSTNCPGDARGRVFVAAAGVEAVTP